VKNTPVFMESERLKLNLKGAFEAQIVCLAILAKTLKRGVKEWNEDNS
jgi:hypothetical protein